MILFLLQRGTKAFTLNIAGLFVGSLESAAMVRKICVKIEVKIEKVCLYIYMYTVVEYCSIVFHRSSFCTELI